MQQTSSDDFKEKSSQHDLGYLPKKNQNKNERTINKFKRNEKVKQMSSYTRTEEKITIFFFKKNSKRRKRKENAFSYNDYNFPLYFFPFQHFSYMTLI